MDPNWLHPRDQLVATMARIYRQRMTTTSGGNLSIRDPDGSIWITPSRVDKGSLQAADIVRMKPDGSKEGIHPPSSEWPFHAKIFKARPDLNSVVHAHPGALVAFSICRLLPDTRVQSHAFTTCGKLAFAPYACPGTQELGDNIAAVFAEGADCVLLENHGVVIGGTDLQDAFQRFETLEFVARTLGYAALLGPVTTVPEANLGTDTEPAYAALSASAPDNHEKELRQQICRFIHRSYQQKLLISTAGAFSTRLDQNRFVITPRRRDRFNLQPPGLVQVAGDACSPDQYPSRAARLHAEIYARLPEVGAIINAQPACASAFCMTSARLDTRTIPESALVLRDVPNLPFLRLVEDAEEIARHLSLKDSPVVLVANEGTVIVGRTLLEAFDRLEVLEATAEALLTAKPLGPLVPMSDDAMAELDRVFGG